jgi:hypothetical protein
MRALLLQVLYPVRSERQLMEQMRFKLLFRWFVGLALVIAFGLGEIGRISTACYEFPRPARRKRDRICPARANRNEAPVV